MPVALDNHTTTDNFADSVLGGGGEYSQGALIVANNPVAIQIDSGPGTGEFHTDNYPYVSPSIIPIQASAIGEKIFAVRFKSYTSGKPAQVAGWLLEKELAGLGPANAFTGTISSSGGVSPGQSSLQIQRNGTLIGTEPILDIVTTANSPVVLADDAANTRVTMAGQIEVVAGIVSAAGAVAGGVGFGVVRNGVGDYTVTYTSAFNVNPGLGLTLGPGIGFIVGGIFTLAQSTAGFHVNVRDSANNPQDNAFSFTAVARIS